VPFYGRQKLVERRVPASAFGRLLFRGRSVSPFADNPGTRQPHQTPELRALQMAGRGISPEHGGDFIQGESGRAVFGAGLYLSAWAASCMTA